MLRRLFQESAHFFIYLNIIFTTSIKILILTFGKILITVQNGVRLSHMWRSSRIHTFFVHIVLDWSDRIHLCCYLWHDRRHCLKFSFLYRCLYQFKAYSAKNYTDQGLPMYVLSLSLPSPSLSLSLFISFSLPIYLFLQKVHYFEEKI